MIIDTPNIGQGSKGKVRATQTDTGNDLVDQKLHCDCDQFRLFVP